MSRNGRALALLSVALLALVSASALAETDVYSSGVVRGKYLYSTDEEASVWDTRVDFDASIGALTLGAVYRGYWLSDDEYNPANVVVADPNDVKHRYAALEYEDLYLRAGHFSTTFGHGLTLRSYEDVDLEHDTLLDGFFAECEAGMFDVTVLTGASREDSGDRFYAHTVHGARVSVPVGEWVEVAGSAVERSRIWNDEDGEFGGDFARFEDGVRGAEVSGWIGPFTFGGEYAERSGDYPEAAKKVDPETGGLVYPRGQVETQGHATYASGTLDLGWATLFGEFKDFDDFAHSLVNPPTCVREHLWTLMNRATYEVDLNDERGFLVEGSSALGDALFVTGGASEARSHDRDLRHWEMFGHATYDAGSNIALGAAASRSREYLFGEEGGVGKFTEHTTGVVEADLTFALGALGDQTVELTLEMQRTEDPALDTQDDYVASVAWYPGLDLIPGLEDLTVSGVYEKTTADWEERQNWVMLSVRKSFANDLEAEIAGGTERGGKKCAGGICRYEPEFEGVRFRLTKFF
ncbi:hypothetical protein KAW64_12965 [bacterium]|nr:hypothetical protein [bacterium]